MYEASLLFKDFTAFPCTPPTPLSAWTILHRPHLPLALSSRPLDKRDLARPVLGSGPNRAISFSAVSAVSLSPDDPGSRA